jgi:prevent-host-death family protein
MLIPIDLYIYVVQHAERSVIVKNVSISELRANLLQYLTRVQQGERIEVTSRGTVLATLVPPVNGRDAARARLDELAASAEIGDVLSPIGEDWEAAR